MFNGAIARIVLRYGVGGFLGYEIGQRLSGDEPLTERVDCSSDHKPSGSDQ